MADNPDEWRAERRGEPANGPNGRVAGWVDDRGVSEVIGSILVFGLLVSLLAIVQMQAVPNANGEVEAKHSADVQGDMANLQSAIVRTGTFGGAESTTVETGMSYPPRLVLYNPPAVQGQLSTSDQESVLIGELAATDPETADYFSGTTSQPFTEWDTSTISYRVDYNRYDNAPTVRYEHTAVVNDFGEESTVESRGSLINGNRISLVLLRSGLQESSVRASSVTTYPVSAPAQPVDVETTSDPGFIRVSTNIDESVWATELLADQYDTSAFASTSSGSSGTPAEQEMCVRGTSSPDQDDGRYVVGCEYIENSDAPNEITIFLQESSNYDLAVSRVGFSASSEPTDPTYLTDTDSAPDDDVTFEIRDRYNNPVEQRVDVGVVSDPASNLDSSSVSPTTKTASPNGEVTVSRASDEQAVFLTSGPNAFDPTSQSRSDCVDDPGCALIASRGAASPVPKPVELVGAGITEDNEITLQLSNLESEEREISKVKLNHVTVYQKKTAVGEANLLGSVATTLGLDTSDTEVTDVIDGPDGLSELTVGSGSSVSPGVTENGAPAELSGTSPIPAGSTESVALVFDKDFNADTSDGNFESGDAVQVSVTLTYGEDELQKTYTTMLHAPEDDDR